MNLFQPASLHHGEPKTRLGWIRRANFGLSSGCQIKAAAAEARAQSQAWRRRRNAADVAGDGAMGKAMKYVEKWLENGWMLSEELEL